ncbi:N-acyl homoserine lactonase family protein [Microbacterium sp. NPDC091313]
MTPAALERIVASVAAAGTAFEVLAVHVGSLQTQRSHVFLNHDVYREPDGPAELGYYFWVLRAAENVVLVDTGFSREGAASRGRRHHRSLAQALSALGIATDEVSRVVLSHAHYDHAGNLGALPAAAVTMHRDEFEFWRSDASKRMLLRSVVDDADLAVISAAHDAGRVDLITSAASVTDGLAVVPLPGHTPGEVGVLVRTAGGVVVLACDAAHLDEEIDRDMPFRHVTDLPATYASLDVLRALRAHPAVTAVIAGHDRSVETRFPAHPAAPFAFVIAD